MRYGSDSWEWEGSGSATGAADRSAQACIPPTVAYIGREYKLVRIKVMVGSGHLAVEGLAEEAHFVLSKQVKEGDDGPL